jgi:ribose transport system permease protein
VNQREALQSPPPAARAKAVGDYGRYKILGIFILLVAVSLLTGIRSRAFYSGYNLENLLSRTSMFGILGIGAAFVMISGGIDLSIGSVVALVGCLLPWLLTRRGWPVGAALLACAALSLCIGLAHGLLITKLRMLPFIATLCGLLLYRGIARGFTGDQTQGFQSRFEGLRQLSLGRIHIPGIHGFGLPVPVVILLVVATAAAIFLNRTVWGRYLLALGRSEQAARFSGIPTKALIVLAYVISAMLAGLGGVLFVLEDGSAQPSIYGNFYELWAIAAAVLGGVSLRGGEGSIAGVIIGAAVLQVLRNSITLVGIPDQLDFAVVAVVILAGVTADELVRQIAARRRAARHLAGPPATRADLE